MALALALLLAVLLLLNAAPSLGAWAFPGDGHYTYANLTQPVDHFNASDGRTFAQAYQLYDAYFRPGGPIVYLLGAEGPLTPYAITFSSMPYFASALGGLILASEHRYYGASLPFGAASFSISNLRFLTIENALADYVALLQHVRATVPGAAQSAALTFGGSYGGYLSARIRAQYPAAVQGAVASAAPVFLASAPPDAWYELVTASYVAANASCAELVATAFQALYKDAASAAPNFTRATAELQLCEPLSAANYGTLFAVLKGCFSTITQFNYPLRGVLCDGWPLQTFCASLTPQAPYAVLRSAIATCFNITPTPLTCLDFTASRAPLPAICSKPLASGAAAPRPVPPAASASYDPWLYEACTEFVMPVAGRGMFVVGWNWTLAAARAACHVSDPAAPWAPAPPLVNATQAPPFAAFSRVLFSNHAYDPVRGFAPAQNLSASVVALNVADSGHGLDLVCQSPLTPFASDPPAVVQARAQELQILSEWLASGDDEL